MKIRKTYQTVLKNTFVLIGGRLFSRVIQFFLFIYAARVLGVTKFGIFSYAYALVNLIAVSMDLGISSYVIQQLSRNREKTRIFVGGGLIIKFFLIIAGLCLIMAIGLIMQKDEETLIVLFILGSCMAFDSGGMIFNSVFQAYEKMHYQVVILSCCNFIMSVIGFVFLYYFKNVALFCGAYAIGALMRFAASGYWYIRIYGYPQWTLDIHFLLDLIAKGFPFALTGIFVTIYYYIDSLILAAYCDNDIVGYYNASYRLLEAPLFIISALTTALFPAASRLYQQNKSELKGMISQAFQKAMGIGLSIAFVIAFLSDDLINLIYGVAYKPAASVLPVLIFGIAIIMPSTICGTTIRAIDKQAVSAKVTGCGALFNIVLNLILIPYYSFMGAAWATLLTEVLVLIIYVSLIWRYIGSFVTLGNVLSILGYCMTTIFFLYLSSGVGFWFRICGCAVFIPVLLCAFGIIRIEEIRKIISKDNSSQRMSK